MSKFVNLSQHFRRFMQRPASWMHKLERKLEREVRGSAPGVKTGQMICLCPGKRHAWFESSVGPIRKPLS
jgi:hypothetical protein